MGKDIAELKQAKNLFNALKMKIVLFMVRMI